MSCRLIIPILAAGLLLPVSAQKKEFEVQGNQSWVDTGIDVSAGDLLRFEASGELKYADAQKPCGPEGLPRSWQDLIRVLPLNDLGRGALIGRVGSGAAARPFLIGARRESRMTAAGRLFLGLNAGGGASATGAFKVTVEVAGRADGAAKTFTGTLPPVSDEVFSKIPRRVVDKDGNEGDRVNFLILGTEEQVKQALLATGWVVVDRSVKDSILRAALGTLSRQAYLTMPMSELMVFGRAQDYGFAMSDPVRTVAARHHFRIWKAPFDVGGLTLWVGAGTHDVGFDKDQRTGGVTHKIDPDTDKEREFIGESLRQSGEVVKSEYATPPNTITKAKTAHGEEFFSDGRVLVLYLRPVEQFSTRFADYFCTVLAKNNPDSADLGTCDKWLESPGRTDLSLQNPENSYRILVIPGIMNTCVGDTPAFAVGRRVLSGKYGLTTDILSVPNDSSEDNAKLIAKYIQEKSQEDKRKFIVIGYSKGTPDLQSALATEASVRENVAAFISVAGASGGSPIADSLPAQLDAYMMKAKDKANCKGDLAAGFRSLKKEVRARFLSAYPHPFVPTYSLAAVTTAATVPKNMAATYRMLAAFDPQNDTQLLKLDQVIPESKFLGVIKSDHLTVALAFEKGTPAWPRAALFEALIRFVLDDLKTAPGAPAQKKSQATGWGQ